MSRKMYIKFSEVTENNANIVSDYITDMKRKARLQKKHSAEKKILKTRLDTAQAEVLKGERVSVAEELNAITKCDYDFKEACKPLNKSIKEAYEILPKSLYLAYCDYMETCTTAELDKATKELIEGLGVSEVSNKGVSAMQKVFSTYIGIASTNSADTAKGNFVRNMPENKFNDMIMRILASLFEDNKVYENLRRKKAKQKLAMVETEKEINEKMANI